MTGLCWSRRTTTTIAQELTKLDITISPNTVARLLHNIGYSLRVNHKQISTSRSPKRNLEFEYLAELRDRFQRRHLPIISVDTKKRELVSNFKNPGKRWEPAPRRVYDHDFRSDSVEVAIPYPMGFTMLRKIVELRWSAFPTTLPPLPLMHRLLVAAGRLHPLSRFTPVANSCRYRRQQ
ncbi:MAG: hypothetical protein JOZ14_09220 [Acidobacteria bacterium]|nr:hypothetical protein [Acidobacteriota bacterium]